MTNKLLIALAVLLLGLTNGAKAQAGGVQKRIKFPEFDRATGRIKSILTGDKAVRAEGGGLLITGARLETYQYHGNQRIVDLIIEAPTCLFSFRTRVASSDGPVTLRRADGDASLSGRGFKWNQRESTLAIFNDVRTVTSKGFAIK